MPSAGMPRAFCSAVVVVAGTGLASWAKAPPAMRARPLRARARPRRPRSTRRRRRAAAARRAREARSDLRNRISGARAGRASISGTAAPWRLLAYGVSCRARALDVRYAGGGRRFAPPTWVPRSRAGGRRGTRLHCLMERSRLAPHRTSRLEQGLRRRPPREVAQRGRVIARRRGGGGPHVAFRTIAPVGRRVVARDVEGPVARLGREQLAPRAQRRRAPRGDHVELGAPRGPGQAGDGGRVPRAQVAPDAPGRDRQLALLRDRLVARQRVVERRERQAPRGGLVEHEAQPRDPLVPPV